MDLILEVKNQEDKTLKIQSKDRAILAIPDINKDYWTYKVKLSKDQAILGFPKMGTVGIGFEKEEEYKYWLPWFVPSQKIFNHIIENKGDSFIKDEEVLTAIKMIREAVYQNLSWADQEKAWKLNENLRE